MKFLIICALAPCLFAANHYVRAGAGGTATGDDWANAYTSLPSALTRGDTYYVAAGAYAGYTFDDANSGTSVITVKSPTVMDHGTSTGWSDAYVGQAVFSCASPACGVVFDFVTSYYTIDGAYRGADWQSGYGFKIDNSNKYACTAEVRLNGVANSSYVHDVTVRNVEIDGSHPTGDSCNESGVQSSYGSYSLMFEMNYIHDVGGVHFLLRGDGGNYAGRGTGDDITIQYNYLYKNYSSVAVHGEGCSCSEGLGNFTIRYNKWVDVVGTAIIATPSGGSYNTTNVNNGPWYIYGNLFIATAGASHCSVGGGVLTVFDAAFSGDLFFYSNTTANLKASECPGSLNSGLVMGQGYTTPMQSIYVQNNVWWNSDNTTIFNSCPTANGVTCAGTVTWSHNSYFQGTAPTDSDGNKQVAATDPFLSSGTQNFHLAAATTAWTALGSPYNVDMDGRARSFSRGAFELAPPTTLRGTVRGAMIK